MCISPIRIRNPAKFPKTPFIDVPCGKCVECIKKRYNDLNFRLQNEFMKAKKPCYFFTLTYNDDSLPYKCHNGDGKEIFCVRMRTDRHSNNGTPYYFDVIRGDIWDNDACKFDPYPEKSDVQDLVRSLRDKIRYECKKSGMTSKDIKKLTCFKYFIVSEYGDTTDRPHFHGLIFNFPFNIEIFTQMLTDFWKYGFVSCDYLNSRRVGYTVKYLFKQDNKTQVCLRSKGLGDLDKNQYEYLRNNKTFKFENYNGTKVFLPKYYRDKLLKKYPYMRVYWDEIVDAFESDIPESTIDNNHRVRTYEKSARKFNKNRKNKKQIL